MAFWTHDLIVPTVISIALALLMVFLFYTNFSLLKQHIKWRDRLHVARMNAIMEARRRPPIIKRYVRPAPTGQNYTTVKRIPMTHAYSPKNSLARPHLHVKEHHHPHVIHEEAVPVHEKPGVAGYHDHVPSPPVLMEEDVVSYESPITISVQPTFSTHSSEECKLKSAESHDSASIPEVEVFETRSLGSASTGSEVLSIISDQSTKSPSLSLSPHSHGSTLATPVRVVRSRSPSPMRVIGTETPIVIHEDHYDLSQ